MIPKLIILCLIFGLSHGYVSVKYEKDEDDRMGEGIPQTLMTGKSPQFISPDNRTLCPETPETRPPNRVDTTARLVALRAAMNNPTYMPENITKLDAYLTDITAEHADTTPYDRRIEYISGFSGSNGETWVTPTEAGFWTDGRYFNQADSELDCNWILLGPQGTPTFADWLLEVVPFNGIVGADPKLISIKTWQQYESLLAVNNISMVKVEQDLIDVIWTEERPPKPNNPIWIHTVEFAGVTWQNKVAQVRQELTSKSTEVLVTNRLDETAWLYNIRGNDTEESPFFLSYLILLESGEQMLYLIDYVSLISDQEMRDHLNTNQDGSCTNKTDPCVNVKEYSDLIEDLTMLSANPNISKIWYDSAANYAMYDAIWDKGHNELSPIQLIKSIKNAVERARFPDALLRDSAALCECIALVEKEVKEGKPWTELSAANKSIKIRSEYEHNKGISFFPLFAVGANAAIIHYTPTEITDTPITTAEIFLTDSGGQYLDGTTDVTRTFHFGTPTDEEKEAYTRVLMGNIDLAMTRWPRGLYFNSLYAIPRTPLYHVGWNYNHGTSHGIGYLGGVHEGPDTAKPLHDGQFMSDEPGFYLDGKFGVRLENLVELRLAKTEHDFNDVGYLEYVTHTLVPFEPHLIKYELLSIAHRRWLNAYHKRCEEQTAVYLRDERGDQLGHDWVVARTKPIPEDPNWEGDGDTSTGNTPVIHSTLHVLLAITVSVIIKCFIL